MASACESDRAMALQMLEHWVLAAVESMRKSQLNVSITRRVAGCLRFFTFTQYFDLPP